MKISLTLTSIKSVSQKFECLVIHKSRDGLMKRKLKKKKKYIVPLDYRLDGVLDIGII